MLQDTAVVISQFQTAAAAGQPPDIQFLWNGIYHMESVWLGYLQPLERTGRRRGDQGLESDAAQPLRRQDLPVGLVRAADDLGLQQGCVREGRALIPTQPPKTWDELLAACDKLKARASHPIGGGIQDGYWGEWYFGHALAQNIDSAGEAIELFTGDRDFTDPKYHEHWVRLEDLKKQGFLNDGDVVDRTLSRHRPDRRRQGRHAARRSARACPPTARPPTTGSAPWSCPSMARASSAGQPIMDCQGLGLPSHIADQEAAAAFLTYLQIARKSEGCCTRRPAGSRPTPASTSRSSPTPSVLAMWQTWIDGENIPYLANVVPGQFYEQALLPAAQQVVAGEITGEQAGELAAKVAKEWRDFNPDIVDNYRKWAADLAG